jgi:LSD1 subclass zinc finger protein
MEELMTAHSFQCPSCGAPLLPRGSAAVIRCPHCHTSVIVPEELRQDLSDAQWGTLLFDNFTSNDDNYWLVGSQSSEYFDPVSRVIADGRYHWEAKVNKANSISKVWLGDFRVSDFHLLAHSKHILGTRANSAWGVIFGIQDNHNYYWFRMTDSKFFAVSVAENSEWRDIVAWTRTDTVKPNGVNQLEVVARGEHFVFLINGEIVSEADDNHYSRGLVGLAIEGYTQGETIVFDFLDFTLRAQSVET